MNTGMYQASVHVTPYFELRQRSGVVYPASCTHGLAER